MTVKERPVAKGRKRKLRVNTRRHLQAKRAADQLAHDLLVGSRRARYRRALHSKAL